VLDDDDGVAHVAQLLQGVEQATVVALVEPDAGLIEHVEYADEATADLAGQPDALPLAAGEAGGGAVEGQVVKADVEQELEPSLDLLEDLLADAELFCRQLFRGEGLDGLGEMSGGKLARMSISRTLFFPGTNIRVSRRKLPNRFPGEQITPGTGLRAAFFTTANVRFLGGPCGGRAGWRDRLEARTRGGIGALSGCGLTRLRPGDIFL
jgi:hypothetical protein